MLELPPLSLYIHIPWCVRKCPYCDFNSHKMEQTLPQQEYITALCQDFDAEMSQQDILNGRDIKSIFIGGGTPSLFDASSFERLFDHLNSNAKLAEDIEITLEANPGTVEARKFREFREVGFNRLSLGIQSFNDAHLSSLGRIHDSAQASAAIDIANQAGFDNLNLDLMHGLPSQSPQQALDDLHAAMAVNPAHLSWYQLTIEPNTEFYRRPPVLPEEPLLHEMQDQGMQLLQENGFDRYEVSAYAQPGKQCSHNLNYWRFGDYLGIGAGAHGKLTDINTDTVYRSRKLKQPSHYIHNTVNREAERNEIKLEDRALEFLLNALRIRSGFSIALFESRAGVPFSTIGKKVEYLVSNDLLSITGGTVATTDIGYSLLNSVLEEFL